MQIGNENGPNVPIETPVSDEKIFFRRNSRIDLLLGAIGHGLVVSTAPRTVTQDRNKTELAEENPGRASAEADDKVTEATSVPVLSADERRHSAGLMRVNHVGEVCAQALYRSQAVATSDPALADYLRVAAAEEQQHLIWTAERLTELQSRPSWLVPLWYAGASAIGFMAGVAGDRASLGFMAETERQVEAHLDSHLSRLPASDDRSREIVARMKADEARHATSALARGGRLPPWPLRGLMRAMAKVMTATAYRV